MAMARTTRGLSAIAPRSALTEEQTTIMSDFPWFLPGVAISGLASIVTGRFVAEKLVIRRALGCALAFWVGVILSATMTPSISGLDDQDRVMAWCDLSRIGPPTLDQLVTVNDVSLNVVLFVPLGFLISAITRHRWKILMLAATLPFLIEGVQFFGASIGRECQSADVFDNLTGLLLGYIGGVAMNAGREAMRRLRNGGRHTQ
jgi:hypothetical protein